MKKAELFKEYQELKDSGEIADLIILRIHMPTGEQEIICNHNVEEKMKYVDKTYNEDLVHCNCPDIYIEEAVFSVVGEEGMDFRAALDAMKQGAKVKLPSWGGYWKWNHEKQTIIMHTKDGEEIDIRETQRVEYTLENILSDEWIIADEQNCPELGGEATFSFGEAIKYLKRGFRVARKGWNGKGQYIELARCISYVSPDGVITNCDHASIGNNAIAFVGTSGVQMGWLASQADMLAKDWVFVEEPGKVASDTEQ